MKYGLLEEVRETYTRSHQNLVEAVRHIQGRQLCAPRYVIQKLSSFIDWCLDPNSRIAEFPESTNDALSSCSLLDTEGGTGMGLSDHATMTGNLIGRRCKGLQLVTKE